MFPYLKSELKFGVFWLPIGLAMYSTKIAFMKYKNSKLLKEDISQEGVVQEELV